MLVRTLYDVEETVMHKRQQHAFVSLFIGFILKHSSVTEKLWEREIPLGLFLPLIKTSFRKLFFFYKCHGMWYSNIKTGTMT